MEHSRKKCCMCYSAHHCLICPALTDRVHFPQFILSHIINSFCYLLIYGSSSVLFLAVGIFYEVCVQMLLTFCSFFYFMYETVSIGNHSTVCIATDFTAHPISVHLPLTRLLAGLYVLVSETPEVWLII